MTESWLMPVDDYDEWLNVDLIGCSCGRDDCRHQRKWKAEARATEQAYMERKSRLDCLTDEDREWLSAHGWDGR
jgi:hypothetical protein